MTKNNYVLNQLKQAGLDIREGIIIGSQRPVRCHVVGERAKRGWYKLARIQSNGGKYLIVGAYGIWDADGSGAHSVIAARV